MKCGARRRFAAALAISAIAGAAPAQTGAVLDPAEDATRELGAPNLDPWRVGRVELQGIAVELSIRPLGPRLGADRALREGDAVEVAFRIADTTTSSPQTRLSPACWIHPADPTHTAKEKVKGFLSGGLYGRPRMDLNSFYVLTLNDDATIAVVDPLFGYGGSRLLARIDLAAPGADWLFDERTQRLYVTEHDVGSVAVVDTTRWTIETRLTTPAAPLCLGLQPDGQYLWIACDGASPADPRSGVAVFDARTLLPMAELATGAGHHELDFASDSRFAFVTNELDGSVTVIDTGALAPVARLAVGGRPVAVACSALGRAIWVVDAECGRVHVFDERTHERLAVLEAQPGLGRLRFTPDGRLGLLANPLTNEVLVLDAATRRRVQTAVIPGRPDQIAFTPNLAYVRALDSEIVSMLPLEGLGVEDAPVHVVDFSGGQKPLGGARGDLRADAIYPAPGGSSVVVANPGDRAVYYYKEGMAAPMGNLEVPGAEPRAALVVDRSLRELSPGRYSTETRLAAGGKLDVVLFVDAPRITHAFEIEVAPDPAREAQAPGLVLRTEGAARDAVVGETFELRLSATERVGGARVDGLADLEVLVFNTTGWQSRTTATALGEGLYSIAFAPPRAGSYYVSCECPSRRLRLRDHAPWIVRAVEGVSGR
ncbi:MAG: hypothetical protein HZA53_15485 [Planctomycetes bacterium]|nr:hypothetical protein [Planctomycetota bacterium]